MKAVHVTTLHPPEDVRIWLKECRTLASSGYDVVLLAPVAEPSVVDGIAVHPVGGTVITTGIPALARRLRLAWRAARRERADVYHLHDPELIALGLALKLTRAKVVYDAHEDTPREVLGLHPNGGLPIRLLSRLWSVADRLVARCFDGIVGATPEIAGKYPPAKTALVRNVPLRDETPAPQSPYTGRAAEIVYVGALLEGRGLVQLVEAMEHVREDVTLVLVGSAPPREAALVDRLQALPGWKRVRYEGQLSRERVVAILADARAGLVVFQPITGHPEALPNKLFEYMAAALPVIASDFPLWREIVTAERCGLLVDPQDPPAIARAIDEVIAAPAEGEAMGERGRAAFERTYNWEAEAHHLLDLYERVTR